MRCWKKDFFVFEQGKQQRVCSKVAVGGTEKMMVVDSAI
jgi:hypothetical protein